MMAVLATPARADAPAPSDQTLAQERCIAGLEAYVPAAYFYCLAARDYGEQRYGYAHAFFLESARWGSKQAEYVLGVMALHGDHQPADPALALAWFTLAQERHEAPYTQAYAALRAKLSATQLARARDALDALGPAYTDAVAAKRAERRYAAGMQALRRRGQSGHICLDGMLDTRQAGGTDASPAAAAALASSCPNATQLTDQINAVADSVLHDWTGHVTVGPLLPVDSTRPAPASGAAKPTTHP